VARADGERSDERWSPDEDALVERQLRALYRPPVPDPAFVAQLEEELMSGHPIAIPISGARGPLTTQDGHLMTSPGPFVPSTPLGPHPVRQPSAFGAFATAALLVLTLSLAALALRPGNPTADRPAALLAINATPASTPGVTAEEELLAVALPAEALPRGGDVIFALVDYTIPPDTEGTWSPPQPDSGCPEATCPGVELAYVLEGGMMVTATGPVQVVRAGRGEAEPIPADTEITLGPGDALLRPNSTTADFATTGATSARLVLGSLVPDYQVPPGWEMHDEDHVSGDRLSALSGPATLRLRRAALAVDADFAAPPGAVAQVGVTLANPPALGSRSDGSLINVGTEAATIYALALESAGPGGATPAARS